jgi:plastocyanin
MLAGIAWLACGSDEETTDDSQTIEPSAVTVQEEITLADFSISPSVVEATLGNKIEVALKNDGEADHTFTIDEFFVDEELSAGDESDVTFTPNQPGEFTYYCRIHPDSMQGSIRIARPGEEAPGGDAEESPTEDPDGGGGYGY